MVEPKKLVKSFGYAFSGIRHAFQYDQNLRVHVVIALLVMTMSVFFFASMHLKWEFLAS